MRILSLYDGMSCGMLALMSAGVEVDQYIAYEIDKPAIETSHHNFPQILHMGNVFEEKDFGQWGDIDFLVGGSPCTYWSIAQKNNRETTASGLGWDLFCQYVRALHEAKPKYFIYENNKSMAKAIRDSIREAFGFEEICINSALVSAQNRQRYYWVGKRNADGWYDKVDVQQPEDRGILLKDVLDGAEVYRSAKGGKGFCLDASYWKTPGSPETFLEGTHARANRNMAAEPVRVAEPIRIGKVGNGGQGNRIYSIDGKSVTQQAQSGGLRSNTGVYAVPVRVGTLPREDGTVSESKQYRIYDKDGKSTTLCAEGGGMDAKTGLYAMPVNITDNEKSQTLKAQYNKNSVSNFCCYSSTYGATGIAEPVPVAVNMRTYEGTDRDWSRYEYKWNARQDGKSSTLTDSGTRRMAAEPVPQYATPSEWDEHGIPTKAISGADGKTYTVYSVQDGQITIKGKSYPIKLIDGYYIIRKLTVSECKRLQTVPEWFDFSCTSNTQAYKMLGNGWTVEVIAHLIRSCLGKTAADPDEDNWML